jgi:WD40 repeat protein
MHPQAVFATRYSLDGKTVLTASRDGTIRIYNGTGIRSIHVETLQDVSLSADGKRVLTISLPLNAIEWDADSGLSRQCCRPQLPNTSGSGGSRRFAKGSLSAFNPRILATVIGEDNKDAKIEIWDRGDNGTWTGRNWLDLHSSVGNPYGCSFSKDSRYLATAWSDQVTRIFDTRNGSVSLLQGHLSEVTSAVFSPEGYTVATGSLDGTVRIWSRNPTGGWDSWGIIDTSAPVREVNFSRDGSRVLVVGTDGVMRIYATTPDELLGQACGWLRYMKEFKDVESVCAAAVH